MRFLFSLLIFNMLGHIVAGQNLTVREFASKLSKTTHPQILDARSAEEFAKNRISGAINVNLTDSIALAAVIKTLNPNTPTFTYSINSGRGFVLADVLRKAGFTNVYPLPGGLANWVGAGFPLENSSGNNGALTSHQFKQLIESDNLVLVDFGSHYCGGCRRLAPVLDSLENKYSKDLKIIRIELDDNLELVKEQKIEALPTLVLFEHGKTVWRHKGFIQTIDIEDIIQKRLTQ